MAGTIHARPRRRGPFIPVNCGAFPEAPARERAVRPRQGAPSLVPTVLRPEERWTKGTEEQTAGQQLQRGSEGRSQGPKGRHTGEAAQPGPTTGIAAPPEQQDVATVVTGG